LLHVLADIVGVLLALVPMARGQMHMIILHKTMQRGQLKTSAAATATQSKRSTIHAAQSPKATAAVGGGQVAIQQTMPKAVLSPIAYPTIATAA